MTSFYLAFAIIHIGSSTVLNQIGRLYIPNSDFTGAENVAIANEAQRFFAADGANVGLNVVNFALSNDYKTMDMTYEDTIFFSFEDFLDFGYENITIHDVTSVDYSPKGYLVTCIVPTDYYMSYGWLAFIDPNTLEFLNLIQLPECYLPDHVTTAKDGNLIVISCEGEPDDNESEYPLYNPPGSITIVDVSASINDKSKWIITNVNFDEYNVGNSKHKYLPHDIYLPHSTATVSENIEPEYSSCDYNGIYCYFVLQENNAIAILNLNLKEIIAIYTLGSKDYSKYGLDASDKDGIINIQTYPNLYGLRMPDNIKYFESKSGRKYFATANEGDSKKFDESRVKDLELDEDVFDDIDILQMDNKLGRLKVINQLGYNMINNSKIFNKLYAWSSRDFTVFEVTETDTYTPKINEVFSSNSDFEIITADILGTDGFNCDEYNPSFDKRSDDKGPESECVTIGKCNNGRYYAFIGLERVGGIMVYDITDIDHGNGKFIQYENNRNFDVIVSEGERATEEAGDIGPEQLRFIHEDIFGVPLLVVASADSASLTVYRIDCEEMISFTPEKPSTTVKNNVSTIKFIVSVLLAIGIVLWM